MAGRGYGKTRIGAEFVRKAKNHHGRIALIAETAADVRDVMIEGESGILATSPDWDRPEYLPSKRELRWKNGSIAKTYSGEEPGQLRGPQHEVAWYDELAKYQYAQDSWDQGQFGLRLGPWPRALVTTTPRPIPVIKSIMASPSTVITRGKTYDNARNLAPAFIKAVREKYEGTRLGRQELSGEVLDDFPGALWSRDMLDQATYKGIIPAFSRTVVAVDPSGFEDETGDSQGIIVAAVGVDGYYYVIEDGTVRLKPDGWGRRVIDLYHKHKADRIVAEANYGGAMVRHTIQTSMPSAPITMVDATRGKHIRAEPIAALYEQKKVRHIVAFAALEDQMCMMTTQGYEGAGSPDRLDALVWALTDLSQSATVQFHGIF
jgi:phage terminase large subunit-like protein